MSSSRESPYSSSADNYKRKNYEMFSSGTRQSQKSTMLYKSFPSDCLFCGEIFRSGTKQQFNEMVTKALYSKYSSSQNYYYTKDINEILSDSRSSAVVRYTDFVHFDEEEEYLKRFYNESEYNFKIKTLTEYYKFHNDIARIFVKPAAYTLNRYHDKKRRLDYIRITKMLKEQEEGDGDEKSMKNGQSGHKDFTIVDKILDELNLTEVVEEKKHRRISSMTQNQQPYLRKSPVKQSNKAGAAKKESLAQKTSPPKKIAQSVKPKGKGAHGANSKEVSISNTILDLNMKLGEIINSRSMNIDGTYFENNEIHPNNNNTHHEPNSNLAHFLDFVSRNGGTAKINSIPGIYAAATNNKVTKITSPPSTDRLRPESVSSTLRQKKSSREDAGARAIPESLSKMSSPNTSKPFARITPATEKFGQHQQKSSMKGLSKIKNFEEALKIEPQSSLRKGSSNTSLPRDALLDRAISTTNTSRNNDRASLLRGATKASDDRTRQASTYRERPQLYSSMSGRSTSTGKSKGKTKSIERNTKVVDLLLETQEFALDKNVRIQAFPTQAHRNTKSINFDTKAWNQNVLTQSQQLFGKENIRTGSITEVSGSIVQIISNPVEKDVIKKVEVPKSQEAKKREASQGQTPARELVNDYLYKSREQNKSNTRASTKTKLLSSREAENRKSSTLASSLIQKKMVSHKHTKSDIRLRKPGYNERMDLSSAKGSIIDGRRGKPFDASLLRTSGTYGQANVFSIALNAANPDIKSYTLRSERQVRQEEPPNSERSGTSRMTKARSPENTLSKKYNQNQSTASKKGAMTHREADYRTSEYSPLRVVNRENIVTNQSRSNGDFFHFIKILF